MEFVQNFRRVLRMFRVRIFGKKGEKGSGYKWWRFERENIRLKILLEKESSMDQNN